MHIWLSSTVEVSLDFAILTIVSATIGYRRLRPLNVVRADAEYVSRGYISDRSMMDQRWINGINDASMMHQQQYTMCHIKTKTYHFHYYMECENEKETTWTRQFWNSKWCKTLFFSQVLWPFNYFLSWIREHRLYQRWINDELQVYRWHLHCCIVDTCIAEQKSCARFFENRASRG